MSSSDHKDTVALESVLLSYVAAREGRVEGAAFCYITRYPQYTNEILLLTFELAVTTRNGTTAIIPSELRDRLMADALAVLLADKGASE
jgi:hypothetical protein